MLEGLTLWLIFRNVLGLGVLIPSGKKNELVVKLPEASLKFSAHITATDCIGTQIRVKMGFNSIVYVCSFFYCYHSFIALF